MKHKHCRYSRRIELINLLNELWACWCCGTLCSSHSCNNERWKASWINQAYICIESAVPLQVDVISSMQLQIVFGGKCFWAPEKTTSKWTNWMIIIVKSSVNMNNTEMKIENYVQCLPSRNGWFFECYCASTFERKKYITMWINAIKRRRMKPISDSCSSA